MPDVMNAPAADPGSNDLSDKKGGGTAFMVILVLVALGFAVLWGLAQKNYAEARTKLEGSDGRIATAERKAKEAEAKLAGVSKADEKVAALQRDLDAARKEAADARAEKEKLLNEVVQARKDADAFQTRIVELESGKKDAAPAGGDAKPEPKTEPKKE